MGIHTYIHTYIHAYIHTYIPPFYTVHADSYLRIEKTKKPEAKGCLFALGSFSNQSNRIVSGPQCPHTHTHTKKTHTHTHIHTHTFPTHTNTKTHTQKHTHKN